MLARLWKNRWSLLAFALSFQLLENFLFAPTMGLLGRLLQGEPVVDSTAIVQFLLSPRGFLVAFLGATIGLTIRLVEHAGLSAMVLGALEGKTFRAAATWRWVVAELPRLTGIGTRIVAWSIVTALPLLVTAGLLVPRLLARQDINYYLANWPADFVWAAVWVGLAGVATLGVGVWLLVRWRLVVQAAIFGRLSGRAAFREAASLSRGTWGALALRCVGVVGLQWLLLAAAAGLQQLTVWVVLGTVSGGPLPIGVSFGLLLVLRALLGAAVTCLGACVDAAVFTRFYRNRRLTLGRDVPPPPVEQDVRRPLSPSSRLMVAAILAGLLVAAGVSLTLATGGLRRQGAITVTAHRGDHRRAPENTAAAIREAVATGAQYAEVDVQLSKDGVLVVTHDSDFSRLGGVARKVWDLTYAEIRAIPLGARSAPEFRNEPAPTFDEVLEIARDRIHLNIELKYYGDHQPRLAQRVVDSLRAHQMTHQALIQCLEYEPLREVRRLDSEIPVGYLMSVNAKHPGRLDVDFLSTEMSRATGAFVRAAHRRGQMVYVWTVNTPAEMERMIDMGVDGLITDQPEEAVRRVRAFESLSRPEQMVRRAHAWMAN
jgi:glycerophosphoryl diester phosphodiesterase